MKQATKQLIKELKKQKSKNKSLLFLDTPILVEEALRSGYAPLYLLVSKGQSFSFLQDYESMVFETAELQVLSEAKTNAGIVGVFTMQNKKFEEINTNFVVLDSLQDAGNVGTILRTALACNFKTVILVDSVHLSNMKLIRSSAGAVFKLNLLECSLDEFEKLKLDNLYFADMNGTDVKTLEFPKQMGIVLGNEGNGVSQRMRSLCKGSVSLPMNNNLESLNVAVCGGILMYYLSYFKK